MVIPGCLKSETLGAIHGLPVLFVAACQILTAYSSAGNVDRSPHPNNDRVHSPALEGTHSATGVGAQIFSVS